MPESSDHQLLVDLSSQQTQAYEESILINDESILTNEQSSTIETTQATEEMKSIVQADQYQEEIKTCLQLLKEEISKKDDQIFKLQLNIDNLKLESYNCKSPRNLAMTQVSCIDIPPSESFNTHVTVLSNEIPRTEDTAILARVTSQQNATSLEPRFGPSLSVPDFSDELEKTMEKFQTNLEKGLKTNLEATLVEKLSRILSPSQHS